MRQEIVITTGSRLHFGFLAHRPASDGTPALASLDAPCDSIGARNFGGAGLMIDVPGCVIAVSPSARDSVVCADECRGERTGGPTGGRPWACGEEFAADFEAARRRVAKCVSRYREASPRNRPVPPCRIEVRRIIPPHRGLGSGTQLGLAVAQGLALLARDDQADVLALAHRVGRGERSGLGIHGFARGGFLIDGGKRGDDEIAPLAGRADVPVDWRFLLVTPAESVGLSGNDEIDAFARLPGMPRNMTERLCRLACAEMLPALAESDVDRFGEAMFEFGRTVGEYFRAVQGGEFAGSGIAELVRFLRAEGVRGIAQTSWGPTVAVLCRDLTDANAIRERIVSSGRWPRCDLAVASPLNTGAVLQF